MKEGKKEFWSWLGERLAKLLDPQFLLTAFILTAWIVIIQQPLEMLKNINIDEVNKAKDQFGLILNLTAGLGALFTTALGFVFVQERGRAREGTCKRGGVRSERA